MATVKTQLMLVDNVTGPLQSINRTVHGVMDSFEAMRDASRTAIDTTLIGEAGEELIKTVKLVDVLKKSFEVLQTGVSYASDLVEVQRVVDGTFGNAAAAIDAWSKECLQAYGMNEVSAKRYAGAVGTLLKSSGLTADAAADMSQHLVGLAGDMASFYDLDQATALEKLQAGLFGDAESLKQLGINMSAANLEAYALSQGIEQSYSKMSQAEQVMLRYNYLMGVTANIQGDFARTSDSWANQTTILSQSWLEFTGVLAEILMPVLTAAISLLNDVAAFLIENADVVSAVLVGVAAGVGVLAAAWVMQAAAQWLCFEASLVLNSALLSSPVIWLAMCIGLLVGLIYHWIQSVGGLKNAWEICKLALLVGINAVKLGFFTGIYKILDWIDALKLAWYSAGVAIAAFLGDMKVSVLTILQAMINGAIDIINGFIHLLNKIPGVNIEAIEHVTFATTAAAENEAAKQARQEELNNYEKQLAASKTNRDASLEAYQTAYDKSMQALKDAYAQAKVEKDMSKETAQQMLPEQTLTDLGETSANTKKIADALDITNSNLKYIRDYAAEQGINRYTATEIKIDMTNHNNINKDADIDGIVTKLKVKLEEEMLSTAEGVH